MLLRLPNGAACDTAIPSNGSLSLPPSTTPSHKHMACPSYQGRDTPPNPELNRLQDLTGRLGPHPGKAGLNWGTSYFPVGNTPGRKFAIGSGLASIFFGGECFRFD